jgi:curved DNA-binding protein CbpA
MRTYYSLLNISKSASSDEIKAAYRSMASRYHPDVSSDSNAHEVFKILNRAYSVLSDPIKRQDYDKLIAGDLIFRTKEDEIVESSGALTAYSNTIFNLLFFAALSFCLTAFLMWLGEEKITLNNLSIIEAITAGSLFGLAIGFNSNFQTKELFEKKYSLYKLLFWLVLTGSIFFICYINYQLGISFTKR